VAILLVILFAVISILRNTVKSEKQLRKLLEFPLIGAVDHEEQFVKTGKGKKDTGALLLTNPQCSTQFVESYRMLASSVASKMENVHHKVLMVTSVEQAEGKSTTTANLALALAEKDYRILLVDLNLREPGMCRLLGVDGMDLEQSMEKAHSVTDLEVDNEYFGLYTICNRSVPRDIDGLMGSGCLKQLIDHWRDQVDYIIIDTAAMVVSSDTEDMAALADAILLVIREDTARIGSIRDGLKTLAEAGKPVLGCVYTDARNSRFWGKSVYGKSGRHGGRHGKRK
jgi:capsular exopolysaccharide synthesis family protein